MGEGGWAAEAEADAAAEAEAWWRVGEGGRERFGADEGGEAASWRAAAVSAAVTAGVASRAWSGLSILERSMARGGRGWPSAGRGRRWRLL